MAVFRGGVFRVQTPPEMSSKIFLLTFLDNPKHRVN